MCKPIIFKTSFFVLKSGPIPTKLLRKELAMSLQYLDENIDLSTFEIFKDRQREWKCECFRSHEMVVPTEKPSRVTVSTIRNAASREASPMFVPDFPTFLGDSGIEEDLRERRERKDQEMERARKEQVTRLSLRLQQTLRALCSTLAKGDALLGKSCTEGKSFVCLCNSGSVVTMLKARNLPPGTTPGYIHSSCVALCVRDVPGREVASQGVQA